jgi:hypothetical protein
MEINETLVQMGASATRHAADRAKLAAIGHDLHHSRALFLCCH